MRYACLARSGFGWGPDPTGSIHTSRCTYPSAMCRTVQGKHLHPASDPPRRTSPSARRHPHQPIRKAPPAPAHPQGGTRTSPSARRHAHAPQGGTRTHRRPAAPCLSPAPALWRLVDHQRQLIWRWRQSHRQVAGTRSRTRVFVRIQLRRHRQVAVTRRGAGPQVAGTRSPDAGRDPQRLLELPHRVRLGLRPRSRPQPPRRRHLRPTSATSASARLIEGGAPPPPQATNARLFKRRRPPR